MRFPIAYLSDWYSTARRLAALFKSAVAAATEHDNYRKDNYPGAVVVEDVA